MSVVTVLGCRMSMVTLLGVPSERSHNAGGAEENVVSWGCQVSVVTVLVLGTLSERTHNTGGGK